MPPAVENSRNGLMSRQEVVELAAHHKKENDKLLKSLSEKAQSNKALVAEAKKGIAEINAILDDLLREDDDDDESVPAIVVDESAEPTPRPRAFVPGSRPVSSGVDMTKSIQEMHSLLELEKQRRKEAEEEAKRNIEEQLLQRERLDKERQAQYEQKLKEREEARKALEEVRQKQEEEERKKDDANQRRLLQQAKLLSADESSSRSSTLSKTARFGNEDPAVAEARRRKRAERLQKERELEAERLRLQEQKHQTARAKVGSALAKEDGTPSEVSAAEAGSAHGRGPSGQSTTSTGADNRDWIKDINDLADNALTIKMKVNSKDGALLSFREKMLKFAASQQANSDEPISPTVAVV